MLKKWMILAAVLAAVSCRRDPEPGRPAAETAAAADTAEETGAQVELLRELTQAARKYGMEKQKAPKSLEELAAGGYLPQVPAAPAGKKFAISPQLEVILEDN